MIGWPPEMANQQRPAQYEKTNHFDFKGNLWKNNALHTEQELKEENISDNCSMQCPAGPFATHPAWPRP